MVDPIAGLGLVVAQSPEVARAQTPIVRQIALSDAQMPQVVAAFERAAADVVSVQRTLQPIPVGPNRRDAQTGWTYTRDLRKLKLPAGVTAAIGGGLAGAVGSVVDLAA